MTKTRKIPVSCLASTVIGTLSNQKDKTRGQKSLPKFLPLHNLPSLLLVLLKPLLIEASPEVQGLVPAHLYCYYNMLYSLDGLKLVLSNIWLCPKPKRK